MGKDEETGRHMIGWTVKGLLKKDEHRTSNVEWEKMKKQAYDLEERLLPSVSKRLKRNRNSS
jgi:hypothetical protein